MGERRFVEMSDLIGSEASVPNLIGGKPEAATAVGRILGNNFGCFGSGLGEQTISNGPLAHGDPFSRNQGRKYRDFDHQEGENTATERVFGRFSSGLGVPQVDYCHYQSEIAETASPYIYSGGDRVRSAAQAGTSVFKNAFDDLWTVNMDYHLPEEEATPRTDIINHLIKICGFSHDSLMV
jgi:hypothetical protein